LRGKHRTRVLANSVMSKTFKLKWQEVIGDWRKLHNEELHDLYLPNIIRVTKDMCGT
jgi:hypothetical protein